MFIHSEKLNPCKCGSKNTPVLDSDDTVLDNDDMASCWMVECYECGQIQYSDHWTLEGAVNKWNKENPIK